MIDVS
jgi:hypothetical protein